MATDDQTKKAFDELQAALDAEAPALREARVDICRIWKRIRRFVPDILDWLKKQQPYGPILARLLEDYVIPFLDKHCGVEAK